MILDRWVIHGNCLIGYIYDTPGFKPGTRVQSEAIRFIDTLNMVAECVDGKYILKEPGTKKEHTYPIIGAETKMPEINESIFLNPRG